MQSETPPGFAETQDPFRPAMPERALGTLVYRAARRLESYSFATAPEQLAVLEGLRAAVVVASLVALAVWLNRPTLSWAAFGAFWTCLADPGGPDRRRLTAMGGFALAGAIACFAAALAAWSGMAQAGATLLVLAFLTGLSGTYGSAAAQVGTLAAVVAVVAVGFPQPPHGAMALSATFLLGSAWALLVCIGLWRIHPHATARRALGAVYVRLGDMTRELLALDQQGTADGAAWTRCNADHRGAVRSAIERARGVILDLGNDTGRYTAELDTADHIFAALIAAGHDCASRDGSLAASERELLHRLLLLLAEACHQTARRTPHPTLLADEAAALARAAAAVGTLIGQAVATAARALRDQAEAWQRDTTGAPARPEGTLAAPARLIRPIPAAILRHAARIAVAVLTSYALAAALELNFSYWATMATVVVVQPFAPANWPRSLERMLGSIAGGVLAALLMMALPTGLGLLPAIFPIATATIALRRVNYTLFVVFVSCLFVLVAELLQPSTGIATARAINNVIGSVVGTAAGLLLWPDRRTNNPATALTNALAANLALAARVIADDREPAGFDAVRRAAGVASTSAETTCHRLALAGQSRRAHLREATSLLAALRALAGSATAYAMTGGQPDAERAAALSRRTALLIEAVRNPSAAVQIPTPGSAPGDDLDAAIGGVTRAVMAYAAAFRPRTNPRQPAPQPPSPTAGTQDTLPSTTTHQA